jgi:hypothetical protein
VAAEYLNRAVGKIADQPPSQDNLVARARLPFKWHIPHLRSLGVTPEWVPIDELAWQLQIPLFETVRGGPMDLVPLDVLRNPRLHPGHYRRILHADLNYPLDTMKPDKAESTIIMDGFHRLLRAIQLGRTGVEIRRIPPERRDLIERLGECSVCELLEAAAWENVTIPTDQWGFADCRTSVFSGPTNSPSLKTTISLPVPPEFAREFVAM